MNENIQNKRSFTIIIEETVSHNFEVFADNLEEAIDIVIEKYKEGLFVLEPGELISKQMSITDPADKTMELFEF